MAANNESRFSFMVRKTKSKVKNFFFEILRIFKDKPLFSFFLACTFLFIAALPFLPLQSTPQTVGGKPLIPMPPSGMPSGLHLGSSFPGGRPDLEIANIINLSTFLLIIVLFLAFTFRPRFSKILSDFHWFIREAEKGRSETIHILANGIDVGTMTTNELAEIVRSERTYSVWLRQLSNVIPATIKTVFFLLRWTPVVSFWWLVIFMFASSGSVAAEFHYIASLNIPLATMAKTIGEPILCQAVVLMLIGQVMGFNPFGLHFYLESRVRDRIRKRFNLVEQKDLNLGWMIQYENKSYGLAR